MSTTDQLWFRHPVRCWALGGAIRLRSHAPLLRSCSRAGAFPAPFTTEARLQSPALMRRAARSLSCAACRFWESATRPSRATPCTLPPLPPPLLSATPRADIKQFHGREVELREVATTPLAAAAAAAATASAGGAGGSGGGAGSVFRVPLGETHPCDSSHLTNSDDIAQMNNMHEVRPCDDGGFACT